MCVCMCSAPPLPALPPSPGPPAVPLPPSRTGGMPGGGGPPLSDASDPGCVHYNEKLEECLPTPRGIAVHPSSEQHLDAADQPNVGGEEWDWQGRSSNHSPPLCSQRDDDTALGCCSLLLL
ncbi:unnamed protein product [Gadus morhua 'NCC']